MINIGTNIHLVSCEGIQISNIGNKRTCEKENEIPNSSVGNKRIRENEDKTSSKKIINNNHPLNQDVDEYHEINNSSDSLIAKNLIRAGGIGRYKIVFLPEENRYDQIKLIFNVKEWAKLEMDWSDVEKKTMVPVGSGLNKEIDTLLKKYNTSIIRSTTGYSVDLNKIAVVLYENPIANHTVYNFTREWPCQWIQSIYNAFVLCFQLSVNPLHNSNLSEYAYRDRIVNRLLEDVFLDINNVIYVKTGEIENTDRKDQKDLTRLPGKRHAIGWSHDVLITIKANSVDYQVGFGEVVGNACVHDVKKMTDDREKILKSMRLGIARLRQILRKQAVDDISINNAETFGILVYKKTFYFYSMHYVEDLYLVDQFDEFTIPDNSGQLLQLSDIIKVMISFKERVLNLHRLVQNSFNNKHSFRRRSVNTGEIFIPASP